MNWWNFQIDGYLKLQQIYKYLQHCSKSNSILAKKRKTFENVIAGAWLISKNWPLCVNIFISMTAKKDGLCESPKIFWKNENNSNFSEKRKYLIQQIKGRKEG